MIGGASTLWDCGKPKSRDDDVVLEYSTNAGKLKSVHNVLLLFVHKYIEQQTLGEVGT